LKIYSEKKINSKDEFEKFQKEKNKHNPVSIISNITGKEIIYNTFDREILNDDNVGKYVVVNNYTNINGVMSEDRKPLISFVENNIGTITKVSLGGGEAYYDIKYSNIPPELQAYFTQRFYDNNPKYLICVESDTMFISDNYNDCLTYISSKKYNL